MNDDITIALVAVGSLTLLLVLWVAFGIPLIAASAQKDARAAKERRDAEWLALVDEWNKPASPLCGPRNTPGSAAHARTTHDEQKATEGE
jgi:hypothetical protein